MLALKVANVLFWTYKLPGGTMHFALVSCVRSLPAQEHWHFPVVQ